MSDRNQSKKMAGERRRAPRIATSNFLGYVCLGDDGAEISEGYGWTTNLSMTGIQMETFRVIESERVLILAIDLYDQLLEINGEVVYAYVDKRNRYIYGVHFLDSEESQRNMVTNFVKSYCVRDKKMMESMK